MSGFVCGVDIGGTFTDCVLIGEDGRVAYGKALSSPGDSFQSGFFGSIDAAAEQLGIAHDAIYTQMDRLISHGSTVATNIVVERKGAKIGLIATKGFEDTTRIMRGMGRATGEPPETLLKVAETHKPEPLVPQSRVYGVAERMDAQGQEVVALNEAEVAAAAQALVADGVDTIAIALPLVGPQRRARGPRAGDRRGERARRLRDRVERDLEGRRRVRALRRDVDQRVRRPGHQPLPAWGAGPPRRDRLRGRAAHHAVPRRHGPARDRRRPPDLHDRLRPRRRPDRLRARVRGARDRRHHRLGHGRHELRRRDHQGRRAARRRRHAARQVPLPRAGARGHLDRRRRRLDRVDRQARRRPARRPRERELAARPRLLRPRRHAADRDRRRRRARLHRARGHLRQRRARRLPA